MEKNKYYKINKIPKDDAYYKFRDLFEGWVYKVMESSKTENIVPVEPKHIQLLHEKLNKHEVDSYLSTGLYLLGGLKSTALQPVEYFEELDNYEVW